MRSITRFTAVAAALAAAGIAAPAAASAAPTVTEASGPNAAAIQAAVDSFRNQLGTANGTNPPTTGGRRQIVWDGVPDGRAAPSFMPENNFRNVGALFSTPGVGFEVSGDDNNDNGNPDADPDQVEFTDINPTYDDAFAPFSPERLFAPIGSNVTETEFVVPELEHPGADERLRRRLQRRRPGRPDEDRAARFDRVQPRRLACPGDRRQRVVLVPRRRPRSGRDRGPRRDHHGQRPARRSRRRPGWHRGHRRHG